MKETLHFIGIGGAGMSGLAEVFHSQGYIVQGSDIKKTKVTGRLEARGIRVIEGHSAENINGAAKVIYSSCITDANAEIHEARRRNIPVVRRIEALNIIARAKDLIAISGAHGKTTTTSLAAYLLISAGLDPTVFIGADVGFLDGNARCGQGRMVITEADESDGSFLLLKPFYSVSTNIDREHMDYYSSMNEVLASYKRFIENTEDQGIAFVCVDDDNLKKIARESSKRIVRYGFSKDADIAAEEVELLGLEGSRFDFVFKGKKLGRVEIPLIGRHNVLNSLAAIGLAMELGVDFAFIKDSIRNFKGAERRFIVRRLDSDILVIDDYAHHPTEIKATLKVLEDSGKRIVTVFQPHRYSRTKYLREQFGKCFDLADHLVITDIYSAHEAPMEGVSALDLCESAKRHGHKNVYFVEKQNVLEHLMDVVKPGDAIFILGAGDIDELPEKIVKLFRT
ncbi:MAG: UDP-N-acetylmuramate--L-alanine ligase [Candidatus Omnitrophica bacterium]|nr:UDP-N-acetylmuramate--L-alanine ligase [Candidatus Omnitrophota bacterium]